MKVKARKTINLNEIDVKLIAYRPDDGEIDIRWEENGKRASKVFNIHDDLNTSIQKEIKSVMFTLLKQLDFITETKNPIVFKPRETIEVPKEKQMKEP